MTWEQMYHFVIVYSISLFSIVVTRDTIFVTDIIANKIRKAPIESLQFEDIPLQYVETPVAVDYDPVDSKLYWADEHFKAIIRANLDGTQEEVVVPYLNVPKGLSIDVQNRHLYWTDTGTDTIGRANLDGTDRVVITSENHDEPRAIVVDSLGGFMYWTDWGVNNSKIEKANLDGSNRVVLVDTGLHLPYGLAVDLEGSRIYWCDAGLNTIDTIDLNGQDRFNLGTFRPEDNDGVDIHPSDIGVYNDYIYWTDFTFKQIIQMNKLVGRGAKGVGPAIFERAGGLHIFEDEVNECSSNPCNAGECIDEINFYTCNCTSTGYDGERCEINIDDCAASPCLNAGICTDLVNAVSCTCTAGFYGDLCQHDIDDCAASPCLNAGNCTDLVNTISCECVSGFYGNLCQHNVDDCDASPCLNAGICTDLVNAFSCQCSPGFYGDLCEHVDTPITGTTSKPPHLDNSLICIHPGDIDNGHVINDNHADPLVPGTRLKFLCADDYDIVGANIVFCQTDGTWSEKAPSCVADSNETELSPSVVYGGGAGGVLVIVILIVILIAVCCKKRNSNKHSNVVVHYTANGSQAPKDPKDMAEYSTSVTDTMRYNRETTLRAGFDRPPMATPRGTKSNHVYDDVKFGAQGAVGGVGIYPPEYPPSYGSVVEEGEINNGYITLNKDAESEVKSEYLYMKTNEVKTPIYDVPKPSNDEK